MKIFVSSTFQDLENYRQSAIRGLRQLGHEVIAMEDFTAASAPPLSRVLEKVAEADAYVGVFAWRYGYVPQQSDAKNLPSDFALGTTSITHAEYLEAKARGLPVLAFLLEESVPWSPMLMDSFAPPEDPPDPTGPPGAAIRKLRTELQTERIVAFFKSPEDLEARVTTAVTVLGMSLQVSTNLIQLTSPVKMVNDSATDDMETAIAGARNGGLRSLTIDIGTEWWSTKLYLMAVLADRLTQVQRVAIVKGTAFVGLLSLRTILRGLEQTHPVLVAYRAELGDREVTGDGNQDLSNALSNWSNKVGDEWNIKIDVTVPALRDWFGEALLEQPVDVDDLTAASIVDLLRILDYPSLFVPVRVKNLKSPAKRRKKSKRSRSWPGNVAVIDKRALSDQLAQKYLDELLDRARLR